MQRINGRGSSFIVFSPDGTRLVTGEGGFNNGTIHVWDVATGEEVLGLTGHRGLIESVAFSPDGMHIISGSHDDSIRLWNVEAGEERLRISRSATEVNSIDFSPDEALLATSSFSERAIRMWDVATGIEQTLIQVDTAGIYSIDFSPDGTQIALGLSDETVRIWDVVEEKEIQSFTGHAGEVLSVAYSLDGSQIVSGSSDNNVFLWDVASGSGLRRFTGHSGRIYSVALSPDGTQVASASRDGTIRIWDVATGQEIHRLESPSVFVSGYGNNALAFSPDGVLLATGSRDIDNTVRLWDVATGEEVLGLTGHRGHIGSVAFSPDGMHIISGSNDETIRLWDVATGQEIDVFEHGENVSFMTVSNAGTFIASAGSIFSFSSDRSIKLWDAVKELEFMEEILDQQYPRAQPIEPLVLPRASAGLSRINYTLTPEPPEGLDFDQLTRTIRGTPTTVTADSGVEYTYIATVANGASRSLSFTINVYSPVSTEQESFPQSFSILGNYPNPFHDATQLMFDLPWSAQIAVEVMDIIGRKVLTIPEVMVTAGRSQSIQINAESLPPGIYLYRLTANSSSQGSVVIGRFVRTRQ